MMNGIRLMYYACHVWSYVQRVIFATEVGDKCWVFYQEQGQNDPGRIAVSCCVGSLCHGGTIVHETSSQGTPFWRSLTRNPHAQKYWLEFFPIWVLPSWWYPQSTPKWSFLVGKPMVVGETHHFRKSPSIPLQSSFHDVPVSRKAFVWLSGCHVEKGFF